MLQLQSKELDICRISKLLAKHNIKASIDNEVITLDGEISDELLSNLCDGITIRTVQNYRGKITSFAQNESISSNADEAVSNQIKDKPVVESTNQGIVLAPPVMQNYDLLYPTVKRGEVYSCDFGEPYGCEQGYIRYAIVVQNDDGNLHSPGTIVLACTTEPQKRLPVHYHFVFSNENMLDYDVMRVGLEQNIVMAEQIRTVDKTRLRKFLGTMTPEFMDKVQKIIDISLQLTRTEKVVTKTEKVYIDKPVYKNAPIDPYAPKERKDLNLIQIQLLSMVNIEDLFKISQTRVSDEIKSKKILQLFGFDMQKNGVQYLFKAILISPKDAYFNLETLCEDIFKNEPDIDKDEIKRLIIARVKERFKLKKSPTIDFIRLVNSFLTKKEDEQNEKIDI